MILPQHLWKVGTQMTALKFALLLDTFIYLFLYFIICVCLGVGALVPWCVYGSQGTACRNWFSPFTMWFLGIEHRSSGLMARPLPAEPSCRLLILLKVPILYLVCKSSYRSLLSPSCCLHQHQ